jgi:addiction module HigA family antidote
MLMKYPPHPGRLVKREIEEFGLTITDASAALGVSRQALNNLINEKSGISAEMAIRLAKALGSTPDKWVKLWAQYDLAQALKRSGRIKVRKLEPVT